MYVIDPLQQFRLAKYSPAYISEIYQNAGVAKNANYDTVIVGSSLVENFRPSYIKKQLGWSAVKLSISGTNAFEQAILLETAIATGQVKNAILGIDVFRLAVKETRKGFPTYLYSYSGRDKLKYLLNIGNIDFILNTLAAKLLKKQKNTLDDAFIQGDEKYYGRERVIADFTNAIKLDEREDYSLTDMQKHFDQTIFAAIKNILM